jgi:transcriptional regulator with XRE-family HTH domain
MEGEPVEAFARRINVPMRTVQRWRSGETEPRSRDLLLVARALGRDPAWFYPVDEPNDDPTEEAA